MSDDEVKKQIGSLVSRAREALVEVRDVVVRTSQLGKLKMDATFLRKEQDKALQRLGTLIFEQVEEGELTLSKEFLPHLELVRSLSRQLQEQEEEMVEVEAGR